MLVTSAPSIARPARELQTPADPDPGMPPDMPTYDYALSPLLAAIGRGQLRDLDERSLAAARSTACTATGSRGCPSRSRARRPRVRAPAG